MAKLIKPLVVLLLLLSIVSLVLGIMLFTEREILKGRTQNLEQATMNLADSLQFEDIQLEQIQDYDRMQTALNRLNIAAQGTYQELQDTTQDLADVRLDLEQTREELTQARSDLNEANRQVASHERRIEEQSAEITRISNRISQIEDERDSLRERADNLETQLAEEQERSRELAFDLETAREELDAIYDDFDREIDDVPPGLKGRILVVSPEWNFVILDIGSDKGLGRNVEMLVHRDDELIGKVRISAVEKDLAIAEILDDWQQRPIREGDHVLF